MSIMRGRIVVKEVRPLSAFEAALAAAALKITFKGEKLVFHKTISHWAPSNLITAAAVVG